MQGPFFHVLNENYEVNIDSLSKEFSNDNPTLIKLVQGSKITSIKKLFKEFSEKLKFPSYFSYNWASFDECINDLEWLDAKSYVIVLNNVEKICNIEKEDIKIFFKILNETASEWNFGRNYDDFPTDPTPFHIILKCNSSFEEKILTILNELDIKYDNIVSL